MADLSTLIRLHRHELDAKRRQLMELYSVLSDLHQKQSQLRAAYEEERRASEENGQIHYTLFAYGEKVRAQIASLNEEEIALENEIIKMRESIMETFSEMKKYEMTEEQRARLADEERKYKEMKDLDDVALERFRRREE